MSTDINKIAWENIHHAYGTAQDLPELINTMLSKSVTKADNALMMLENRVFHQQSLYDATSYIVPFLIKLLQHPEVHNKHHILSLLRSMYTPGHFILNEFNSSKTKFEQEEQYKTWVEKTRATIVSGAQTFIDLLDDKDVEVRIEAIRILTIIPIKLTTKIEILNSRIEVEQDETGIIELVLAVSQIIKGVSDQDIVKSIERLIQLSESHQFSLVRIEAILATIFVKSSATTDKLLDRLIQEIQIYQRRYNFGDAKRDILDDFIRILPLVGKRGTTTLTKIFATLNDLADVEKMAHYMIIEYFCDNKYDPNTIKLTNEQSEIVSSLVASNKFWGISNHDRLLSSCLLPTSYNELEKLLKI